LAHADPAILKTEYIYDTGPYPQIHATTIVETPTGLVTAWFGGTAERNPDVCIWVSRLADCQWVRGAKSLFSILPYSSISQAIVLHLGFGIVLFME
jgi:predicted neuraminidase